ncbi:unnamed protein product [Cuscuta europaea]|uniref:Uncharacterized protein n=1 Tax=Cuscuta europaea TaxID=41803 RepID=A0A9P1A1N0_CUSEU|nr:unnamed protein product [Cuscuta europaea]
MLYLHFLPIGWLPDSSPRLRFYSSPMAKFRPPKAYLLVLYIASVISLVINVVSFARWDVTFVLPQLHSPFCCPKPRTKQPLPGYLVFHPLTRTMTFCVSYYPTQETKTGHFLITKFNTKVNSFLLLQDSFLFRGFPRSILTRILIKDSIFQKSCDFYKEPKKSLCIPH